MDQVAAARFALERLPPRYLDRRIGSRWKKLQEWGRCWCVRGVESGRGRVRGEGSRTTRENPPRSCDGGRRWCEAKGGRIGWPERGWRMKVVVKGDPRVAGRREGCRRRRKRRWRDTLLETRRFAGTLSIGVLATPSIYYP